MITRSGKIKIIIFGMLILLASLVAWRLISRTRKLTASNSLISSTKVLSPTPESDTTFSLGNLIYPNSETIRLEGNTIYLKSTDSPEAITNWYKTKISSLGMAINNFVQTNTNGSILNLLNGADQRGKIGVEIKKNSTDAKIDITVSISSF